MVDSLSEEQRNLLERHLELVLQVNESINLTRIDGLEEGHLLHIEDSLVGLEEMQESPEGRYGDLGSGAGYPGIPLAVATGRDTVLVDSRKKKMDAMDLMIKELGLDGQVSTFAGRAELLARREPSSFAVLTARALSTLPVLLELASPLLQKNGELICYKAHVSDEELGEAQRVAPIVGMKLKSDRTTYLSDGETLRRIIVYRKTGKPRVKLPRKEGEAQKHSL